MTSPPAVVASSAEFVERLAQVGRGAGFEFHADEEDPFRAGVSGFD